MSDRDLGTTVHGTADAASEQGGKETGVLNASVQAEVVDRVARGGREFGWKTPTETVRQVMTAFGNSADLRAFIHDLPVGAFSDRPVASAGDR